MEKVFLNNFLQVWYIGWDAKLVILASQREQTKVLVNCTCRISLNV
jgi:hypothetical protein